MKSISKFFSHNFPLIIILVTSFILLSYKIDKPFWGHHDFNNSFYGIMGRNLNRYGSVATKLGQVTNSGYTKNFLYHTHHPPLLIWSLAISYRLFGVSERSTRLIPVIFSLLTLWFFYKFIELILNRSTAFIAVVFWIITPLFLYFGKMAVHEILVLCFMMLAFWRYHLWLKEKSKNNLLMVYFALLGGCMSGWPGFYSPIIIILLDLWTQRKLRKETLVMMIIPVLVFIFQLVHNLVLTGSVVGGNFWQAFALRSSSIEPALYLKREIPWALAYYSKPLVLLATIYLVISLWQRKLSPMVLGFLALGLIHPIFFREAVFRHDYLIYYLLPFFSLAAAQCLNIFFHSNKMVLTTAFMIIVYFSLKSTISFTSALLFSDRYRESVQIGKYIHSGSSFKDRILVVLPKETQSDFENWHISFYSDRKLKIVRTNVKNPQVHFNYE